MILQNFKLFTEYSLANCLNNNKMLKIEVVTCIYIQPITLHALKKKKKAACLYYSMSSQQNIFCHCLLDLAISNFLSMQ